MPIGDVSFALEELITRYDYAIYVREAEVHVEVIPETRFAILTKVTADSVVSLGSTLNITSSLRVGRTKDREVELALSVPDTLFPGFYQLEVGSAALLGDDAFLFGPPPSFFWAEEFLFGPPPSFFGAEESLDDVFARLNKPDENVLLKARLTFLAPPLPPPPPDFPPEFEGGEGEGEPEGEGEGEPEEGGGDEGDEGESEGEGDEGEGGEGGEGEPEGDFGEFPPPGAFPPGPPFSPPAPISTQEDVDLLIEGFKILDDRSSGRGNSRRGSRRRRVADQYSYTLLKRGNFKTTSQFPP